MFKYFFSVPFLIASFHPAELQLTVVIGDLLQDQNIFGSISPLPQLPPIPQNISEKCFLQLHQFYQGLNNLEYWALEMFDASSKMQSGILRGNFFDLGNFDECLEVKHAEIRGKYCLISVDPAVFVKFPMDQHTSEAYGMNFELQRAICVPDACSVHDLELWLYNYTNGGVKFKDDYCQSASNTPKLQWRSVLALCVLGLIAMIVSVCTIADYFKPECHMVIKAFSCITNGKKLLKSSGDTNKMKVLDGLKAMSMIWIIFAHGYLLLLDVPLSNYADVLDIVKEPYVMAIISGTLSVDTFLIVSGFLLSYSIMKTSQNPKNINIPFAIFHRFLRLTPGLAMIVMIHASALFEFIGSGPVYSRHRLFTENCQRYWWSALLYLQNFVNGNNMCVPQSWYLSVDMQLYIISLLLLVLMKRKLRFGVAVIIGLIFVSIVTSFAIGWFYNIPGSMAGFSENRVNRDFMQKYYYQSYTRMAPYLMGLLLGQFLCYMKQKHLKIRPDINLCIWMVDLLILVSCVFAGHHAIVIDTHNKLSNSFYLSLHRPAWSVGIAWIIFACVLGYGGVINKILSLPIFVILSRLSYGMYLVHYSLIQLRYFTTRSPIALTIVDQGLRFWGFFAVSAFLAIIFSLLFESPIIALEKLMFQKGKTVKASNRTEENGKV